MSVQGIEDMTFLETDSFASRFEASMCAIDLYLGYPDQRQIQRCTKSTAGSYLYYYIFLHY
jgi:hypothetical protein